jgi:hypothetical protein
MPLFGPCSDPIFSQRGVESSHSRELTQRSRVCRASPAQQVDDEFDELVDLDRVGMRLSDDRHTQPVPSTFGLVVKTGWDSHSICIGLSR